MATDKYFKISQLSKIFNISVDSIRYYEKVGILNPIRNPINNYRFYTMQDFRRIALIREMLGLGFSTEQIKSFITNHNVDNTKDLLSSELNTIKNELHRLTYIKQNLENRLEILETMEHRFNNEQIEELHLPKRDCVMVRDKHLSNDMIDYYLIKYMNNNNNYVGTVGLCDCYTLDLPGSNPDSEYYRTKNAFFYSSMLDSKDCNYSLPEGTYLSIIYRGCLTKTKQLLPSLFDYAKKQHYIIAGEPIELCYIDEYETNNEEEYLIELQLPVK